jgi:hypothetical protein
VAEYLKGGEFNNGIDARTIYGILMHVEEVNMGARYAHDKNNGKGFRILARNPGQPKSLPSMPG